MPHANRMTEPAKLTTGRPDPQGAVLDGNGANFTLFSEHAQQVELCLFNSPGDRIESARLTLPGRTGNIHHGHVAGLAPGQLYGFRVSGPFEPAAGQLFNPRKLLLDPRARGVVRCDRWDDALSGVHPDRPGAADDRDSGHCAPLGVIMRDREPMPEGPGIAWEDTVLYETHVRGTSALHPAVPESLRGTYLGLAAQPVIDHLLSLGVTSLELLPIQQHFPEPGLIRRGLTNFWGYNTLAFFAPDARFATAGAGPEQVIDEFREMVTRLHAAGLEVILDVVYNHSAEGDETGPTLSQRGIDNAAWYRLDPHDRGLYRNDAGCGNTLNASHPHVLRLIIDSLRYWALQCGVDGFRFDLASTLARGTDGNFRPDGAFFGALWSDPVLARRKLIAEPWDLGPGGYRLGGYPEFFREWNDRFRDDARRFWIGEPIAAGLATRLAGSSDIFAGPGRDLFKSVNFITAHDGFTLADLVSYNRKHNEVNGEGNRDGNDQNHSWNCGVEGPTEDPAILVLRRRQKRNLMVTLLLARGVPMLLGGDELGRSMRGNNNAYCQDNELNFHDWSGDQTDPGFLDFVRRLLALRRSVGLFRRREFLTGRLDPATGRRDVTWLHPRGRPLEDQEWQGAHTLGMLVAGTRKKERATGDEHPDDALLVLFHAGPSPLVFVLPELRENSRDERTRWLPVLDTGRDPEFASPETSGGFAPGTAYQMEGRSVAVMRAHEEAAK